MVWGLTSVGGEGWGGLIVTEEAFWEANLLNIEINTFTSLVFLNLASYLVITNFE